ncbi:hypothetical protein DOTSEDRAFT_20882 [Dothistroma septosporum NZE10]|uniref:Uncharacterized protein n=1 Tax=Dothistroma septosporum (strain NZE10 / CBS 128990) TaxID=675120 RepID=N1PUD4_DOTSN|nr:hypothetical protein DOTSEDRAFT_20882 [Dothistroma septosporum NZE10]
MRSKKIGMHKRIACKLSSVFTSKSEPSTPETLSTAPVASTLQMKQNGYPESCAEILPSGGPIELPAEPDRSLKVCSTVEIAAHISYLIRLLSTAINTRDLGSDSFIWEIFHPDYRFQQDEHLPELSSSLLEHNARMKTLIDSDATFWCNMKGSEDVVPKGEEIVEMLVKAHIVSHGISTVQRVVTWWKYEGKRWRCVKGVGRSDLTSGLPDY